MVAAGSCHTLAIDIFFVALLIGRCAEGKWNCRPELRSPKRGSQPHVVTEHWKHELSLWFHFPLSQKET